MTEEHKKSIGYSQAAKKEERIFNAEMTKSLRTMTETIEPNKQTAVNFLIEQMFVKSGIEVTKDNNPDLFDLFDQAKAMERQQIIDAWIDGEGYDCIAASPQAEQYYTQTFTEPMKTHLAPTELIETKND